MPNVLIVFKNVVNVVGRVKNAKRSPLKALIIMKKNSMRQRKGLKKNIFWHSWRTVFILVANVPKANV